MNKNNNCITLIRLVAAIQVFLGHAVVHLEIPNSIEITKFLTIFQGVPVFFIISGFLIWNSLDKTNNFSDYIRKRILRLYPEMWGGVFFSTLSIIVLYGDKIKWNDLFLFICTQSTVLQFWTPENLRGFGCGTPNGSLWTIGVMVQSYIVIWVLYKVLHKKSKKIWCTVLGIFMCFNIGIPFFIDRVPLLFYKLILQTFIPYLWMFIFGALMCEYFDNIIFLLKKYCITSFMISALINFTDLDIGIYGTLKGIFLGMSIIGFSYKYPNLKIKHDLSYGLYIYHMIVINVFLEFEFVGKLYYIFLALVVSIILSVFSYFTIAKIGKRVKRKIV